MLPPPLARTPEEWTTAVAAWGGRAFHGKQVFRWIQARGVVEPANMSDLPADLRERLRDDGVGARMTISMERRAQDDTRKLLLTLHDGATIETVLIPGVSAGKSLLPSPVEPDADSAAVVEDDDDATHEAGEKVRVTQCISTQVGCAMGCVFCASGVAGLKRHLGADEIVAQVLLGRSRLDAHEKLRNVVYMGMGEPLHNYESTAARSPARTAGRGASRVCQMASGGTRRVRCTG